MLYSVNPPANQNFAQVTKFQLHFDRLPYMTFFCTSASIPGVSLTAISRGGNLGVELFSPGDKLSYEELEIKFNIDEDYRSWQGVHDWIRGMAPTKSQEYQNLSIQKRIQSAVNPSEFAQFSDAILTVYTNKNNPHFSVKFVNCFPTSLSGITFDTALNADTIITATASFKFDYYDIERV
jgi:hypothetical protein